MKRILLAAALAASASAAGAQPVAVTLTEFKIAMAKDTVPSGAVTFRIKNSGTMTHAVFVMNDTFEKGSAEIPAGQEASFTVTLKPGTYDLYCPVSDESHKKAGMARKLVVTPATKPAPPKKP